MQDEGGTLARLALDLGPAAVQFDQGLDQRQADTRATALAPDEAVEDVGLQVVGDAAPGILDPDAHFRSGGLGAEGDSSAVGHGAGGVVQQMLQALGDAADVGRISQCLEHLLDNATRAVADGGAVTLSAEATTSEVRIRVQDTGRGIPYHLQAHVFDRFVRRERGGPGVGLALVKALVELHGGWAEVESEPGKGAAFILHLPLEATAAAAVPELRLGSRD